MHWVVDTVLVREAGYSHLISALERTGTQYTLVRKPPFADYLVNDDKEIIKPIIDGPVFVTGTLSMGDICSKMGWAPGYIDAPDHQELKDNWKEHLLNYDSIIGRVDTIVPPYQDFFIRPCRDTKAFSGQVMNIDDFNEWRSYVLNNESSLSSIKASDEVVISSVKNIQAEYRLFVINEQIVTGSSYKIGRNVVYSTDIPPIITDFAKERIKEYCPRIAICLDIALVDDEPKVVEINSISSAGFYACDMNKFVGAINDMEY